MSNPLSSRSAVRRGFSLIELVIVIVIIGIIAAIAIPRMSQGSAGAADSSVTANLRQLRGAIDLFSTEHSNTFPTVAAFSNQLTLFSNDAGATQATKDTAYVWGPYIREIPILTVGAKKGQRGVAAADAAAIGWIYDETTGRISTNTTATEKDARGVAYTTY